MRFRLAAPLANLPLPPLDPLARSVADADAPQLAGLMLAAYRGTIDDEGEDLQGARAETERLLAGAYGPFDRAASEVAQREDGIVAATLITLYENTPLVAYSMTAPPWQRRGLARAGLLRAMSKLRDAGHRAVHLAVTEGNTPAESLYASLGFVRL